MTKDLACREKKSHQTSVLARLHVNQQPGGVRAPPARTVCWEVIFVGRIRIGLNRAEYNRIEGFFLRMRGEWSQPNRPDKFGIW